MRRLNGFPSKLSASTDSLPDGYRTPTFSFPERAARNQAALRVEPHGIRRVGGLDESGHVAVPVDPGNVVPLGEEEAPVRHAHRTFGPPESGLDQFDRRAGGNHAGDGRRDEVGRRWNLRPALWVGSKAGQQDERRYPACVSYPIHLSGFDSLPWSNSFWNCSGSRLFLDEEARGRIFPVHTPQRARERAAVRSVELGCKPVMRRCRRRREQAGGHDEGTQTIRGTSHYGYPEEDHFLYPTSQGLSIANLAKGKNEIPEFVFLGPGVLLEDGSRTEGHWYMNPA